ncbi:tryptophan 7-halogenase [Dyella subtropica]|uniref:tryptophan 7-halogenase n=1 Tax=Dyella subtropica TaxID=2992127 RepID=UPI002252BFBF|nr:tryptophan 7-halogenase [Dyella subtropica]
MSSARYDVAIAGGGPAGAAAAIVLARSGLRVLVADARREHEKSPAHGFQVGEGLPPSARHLLRELGVHDQVLREGHRQSHGTVAFWGKPAAHVNDFVFQLHGSGLQLDRARFDAGLRDAAGRAGATLIESAALRVDHAAARRHAHDSHGLQLCTADGDVRPIETSWVLDASGRSASLARAFGASPIHYDRLLALYLRLRSDTSSDRDGRTWVEAVEDGWWYSVLLPSGERLISFLFDADSGLRRSLLSGEALWSKLRQAPHLHALCEEHAYLPTGRVKGAEACSSALDTIVGPRWLAVGDAAIAFDPLSSKGISNALYTGMRAADAIMAANSGDSGAVESYAEHLYRIHRTYRHHLLQFYAMETRWPEAAFWRRRQAFPEAVGQGFERDISG